MTKPFDRVVSELTPVFDHAFVRDSYDHAIGITAGKPDAGWHIFRAGMAAMADLLSNDKEIDATRSLMNAIDACRDPRNPALFGQNREVLAAFLLDVQQLGERLINRCDQLLDELEETRHEPAPQDNLPAVSSGNDPIATEHPPI